MHICGRRTPDPDGCGAKSIKSMDPYFRTGIPHLDVPTLDPMFIEEVIVADIRDFRATARNCDLQGLANFTLSNFKVNSQNQTIGGDLIFDQLTFDSEFQVLAKIIVPIKENGMVKAELSGQNPKKRKKKDLFFCCFLNYVKNFFIFSGVGAKLILKYKKIEKKGVKRVYFPSAYLKLYIKDYRAQYSSPTNSPLAAAINSVLLESSKDIIESMNPHLEREISKNILNICNKFCKHYTFDELCPDRE